MKQVFLSIALFVICAVTLQAQVIITQNFDALTAGPYAAQQLGAPWTTWSGTTGNTEDPSVSTTQSSSAPNAVYVSTTSNDFVCHLSDKTTGRYKISFKIFVESGKYGYFNVLNDFAGSSSVWAMQSYFYTDGKCVVDAGAASANKLSYNIAAWNTIDIYIDLDDDFATMMLNNADMVSWKFSSGSFGDGTTNKLDGVNFFGWDNSSAGAPGYFIDDFVFEQITAPAETPTNFSVTVNGSSTALSWTAPAAAPDSYGFVRNNFMNNTGSTALSYNDNGLYPMDYTYELRAFYNGIGYSAASNDTTITIAGGIARDVVLFEVTTCTGCYYCPGAALGMEDLVSNGKNVAVIEYHNNWNGADPYTISEGETRGGTYYNDYVTGNPTTIADGTIFLSSGDHTTSLYSTFLPWYDKRMARNSIHDLDMTIVKTGVDTYTATIVASQNFDTYSSNLYLRTALTESEIAYSWQGQTELNYVCRDMYPSVTGTVLDFSSDSSQTVTINFSTAGFVSDNCEFVAFVQYDGNKDVTKAAVIDLSTVIGIEEANNSTWSIYPNPANDQITIAGMEKAQYEIVNINGQVVMSGMIENGFETINTSNLNQGSYFARIIGSEVIVKSFVIE